MKQSKVTFLVHDRLVSRSIQCFGSCSAFPKPRPTDVVPGLDSFPFRSFVRSLFLFYHFIFSTHDIGQGGGNGQHGGRIGMDPIRHEPMGVIFIIISLAQRQRSIDNGGGGVVPDQTCSTLPCVVVVGGGGGCGCGCRLPNLLQQVVVPQVHLGIRQSGILTLGLVKVIDGRQYPTWIVSLWLLLSW